MALIRNRIALFADPIPPREILFAADCRSRYAIVPIFDGRFVRSPRIEASIGKPEPIKKGGEKHEQ